MKMPAGVIAHMIVWSTVAMLIVGCGLYGHTGHWTWLFLGVPYTGIVLWALTDGCKK